MQESLRLHPIVHTLSRYADNDDVLPLAEPLMTNRGPITELPIPKGQVIDISVYAYNRYVSPLYAALLLSVLFIASKVCGEKMQMSGIRIAGWTRKVN